LGRIFTKAHLLIPKKLEAETLLSLKLQNRQNVEQGAFDLLKMGVQAVYIKGSHQFESAHHNNADTDRATDEATDSLPQQDDWALDYLLISDNLFSYIPKDRTSLCDAAESHGGFWLQ
jgi:hydroxymethylpyrimidine/phosphomethylpyrimidine kinase